MPTTMTILVVLALPSPDRDCPRFESPVAGTCDRSRSVGEEARTFDLGGGKFKPPPSFGGHFLSGRARRRRSRSTVVWYGGMAYDVAKVLSYSDLFP